MLLPIVMLGCKTVAPPEPVGPTPSERQMAWHKMEYYAFVHFNMNTFTNMEWGTGAESTNQFNPSNLDVRQWAKVAREAGMKGIVLTAKHHDGFCLWPTKTTEHSVKNSPWKNGQGDVVKELSEACNDYGLKLGLYLSPWDRNNEYYGQPEYVKIFHEQLRELLTNYGELFEIWFDGANGGSGYYGGANESRKIDSKTYYDWERTTAMIRKLQPNAVIFGDNGPDVRWVGNEEGWANATNWNIMRKDEIYPGWPRYVELRSGHEDGTHWLPAEADVSIRPGWYYHAAEDHQVKTLPHLLDIYYNAIGRNAALLLNLPVDTRGLVHEKDVEQLMALKEQIDKDFAHELSGGQNIEVSNTRGDYPDYSAKNMLDGNNDTYWATDDGVTKATITVSFEEPTEVNRIVLQEFIPLGQRIKKFTVSARVDGKWKILDEQTTVGHKRILRWETVLADKVKIDILESKGPILLSNLALYRAPKLVVEPIISRNRRGLVSLLVPDRSVDVFYTLDSSEPSMDSQKYLAPFLVEKPTTVKAIAINPENGQVSGMVVKYFDLAKNDWKLVFPISEEKDVIKLMDDNPETFWATNQKEVIIDLGRTHELNGFTYWPNQERYPFGIITHYEFLVSEDNRNWQPVAAGEFGNIVNSRIEQKVMFHATKGRYIKLRALGVDGTDPRASFAEIGVLTQDPHQE
ncbi:Alpha-L-fucosidase [Allomuricauda ruestringensis DSM 13258]|uniref:alpha-L-fucosidase n=2 Tax=Flagellimonas TaxID=444459 RepID=G2PS04_ALLRU|nr:Alpha-L-fucosidase [Allomuricauda ruestringensis DSM 13258]